MRVKTYFLSASVVLFGICFAFAQGPQLDSRDFGGPTLVVPSYDQEATPIPGISPGPEPLLIDPGLPAPSGPVIVPEVDGVPVPLANCDCDFYKRVCYKNKKKIAPCADVMVVSVIDPCSRKYDCETKCVQVKICVPPGGCPKVKVTRNG